MGVKSTSELTGGIHIDSQAVESRGAVPYCQGSSECNKQEKLHCFFFFDMTQLPQDCIVTTGRQFTIPLPIPRSSWYLFDQPSKDKRLSGTEVLLLLSPGPQN